jgi:hypothetical protein
MNWMTRYAGDSVGAAASAAGYTTPAWHGTGSSHTVFKTPAFFTDVAANADEYGADRGREQWDIIETEPYIDPEDPEECDDMVEGGFSSEEEAREFAEAECGVPYRIERSEKSPRVVAGLLRFENPLEVDAGGSDFSRIPFGGDTWMLAYLAGEARRRGYDGLIVRNVIDTPGDGPSPFLSQVGLDDVSSGREGYTDPQTTYAIFSPSQFKLGDDITYDDAGNPIPPESRFDPSNPDIRY